MLVIGGAALVSCTKNQDDLLPTIETATTTNALQKVKVENGYLVFEDLAHYDAVATQVIAMTETQRQLWEKQLSFKSYYTLYNEATAAYSDAATEEETQAVLTQNQDIMTLDADQTPERTLRYGSLGLLFNRAGIIKIGNQLKQCTPDDKQVLVFDGDLNTLAAARAAGRTNVAANVYVFDIKRASTVIDERSPNLKQCTSYMGGYDDCLNRKKLRGNIDCWLDISVGTSTSTQIRTHVEVYTNAWYQKYLSGSNKWADYDNPMRVNGSFSTSGSSGGFLGMGPAPAFPITNFDVSVANDNHIELYWNTPWVSANSASIPAVWLDDVHAYYRMTNKFLFSCSSENNWGHQNGEPLNCSIID